MVSFVASGATVTTGIDGLSIAFTQGDDGDATDTNSGINLAITANSTLADTIYGLNIANLAGAGDTDVISTALNIGTGWDNILDSSGFDIVNTTGATTITGSAEGTAALTLTAGDIVLTDGDITLT